MSREMGSGARWEDTTHLISRGLWTDKESRSLQTNRKPHILGDKVPSSRQRKVRKARDLLLLMQHFACCALITIRLALQIRSTHHVPIA